MFRCAVKLEIKIGMDLEAVSLLIRVPQMTFS